jgi:chromate transport protein ChrA
MKALRAWLTPETRSRRLLVGLALYLACTTTFALVAGPVRLGEHTQYNHYALLADAWLHGRQDLVNGPPRYTGNNDFASFHGKTYITFPPFPAVLMVPLVAASGSAENFRDGQFVIWLAGLAPALMFLVLEKLRRTGRSNRSETESVLLAALMAIGTVYFFTAVEGTVWFAALVINVALMALYALFALDAESPALAGVMLGLIFATRVTPILAAPRVSPRKECSSIESASRGRA